MVMVAEAWGLTHVCVKMMQQSEGPDVSTAGQGVLRYTAPSASPVLVLHKSVHVVATADAAAAGSANVSVACAAGWLGHGVLTQLCVWFRICGALIRC